MKYSSYRKEKHREEVVKMDNLLKSRWPVVPREEYIETGRTKTRLLSVKSSGKPPLIILHGTNMLASMFYKEVKMFMDDFSLFIPDIPGETGLTTFNEKPGEIGFYNSWLEELLEKLGLERIYLLGISFGGYLGLNYSSCSSRIISSGYISTSGLGGINPEFLIRGIKTKIFPSDEKTEAMIKWLQEPLPMDEEYLETYKTVVRTMKVKHRVMPKKIDKETLEKHKAMAYFYFGKNEVLNLVDEVIEWVDESMPRAKVNLIPDRRHILKHSDYKKIIKELLNCG